MLALRVQAIRTLFNVDGLATMAVPNLSGSTP
jgi:hypothetical protein